MLLAGPCKSWHDVITVAATVGVRQKKKPSEHLDQGTSGCQVGP